MKLIKTNFEHKKESEKKVMVARVNQHKKLLEIQDQRKYKRQKEIKKQVFRTLSKMEKTKNKRR